MTSEGVIQQHELPRTEDRPLRVLILGAVNSPHTEHLALALVDRGIQVVVGGELHDELRQGGLGDHRIEVAIRKSPTARWIADLMDTFQPDVVHAHWLPHAFLYLLYGATPMIATAWGSDVYRADRRARFENRFVARFAGALTADSADLLDELRRIGASAERTAVINWGIDTSVFSHAERSRAEIQARLGLPQGRIILSPRSLRPIYNPRMIIDAFELLAEHHDDLHLVLKHIHEEEPDLGPLRYPDRVHVVGFVPYEQMADYYRAAEVCVSVPSSDSSPRSVWEAMGCGTPCVLSDLPWVHELIVDAAHALIVPVAPTPLAEAIHRLLEDRELAADITARARSLVEEHRDRERELDRLIGIYHQVARRRPGTGLHRRLLHTAARGLALARWRLASVR